MSGLWSALYWMRGLIRNLVRGGAEDRALSADVESYVELLADEKVAAGMSADAARRAARLEFGSAEAVKEEIRSVRAGALITQFGQDLRYALRMLRRDVGFSTVAILTLALGIGANTAIFSVVNAVLLEPLPYADPHRLAVLWERNTTIGKERDPVTPLNFQDWRRENATFDDLGGYRFRGYVLSQSGSPEQLTALSMSASVFKVLGVDAAAGRVFSEDEERRRDRVVVLTHGFWQRRFGADASVIGRTIALDDRAFTVVGVMPPAFAFPDGDEVDLYAPIVFTPDELTGRRVHTLTVIGRLRGGVSIDAARSDVAAIARRIAAADNTSNPDVTIVAAHDVLVEDVRRALIVLFGTVGFVLLIACANIASLLLVRATTRQREMAMRAALGAGRWRLLRQSLTESVLLAGIGGGAGMLVAWGLLQLLTPLRPPDLPRADQVGIDTAVLLFVTAAAVVTGMLFGLVPALQTCSFAAPRLRREQSTPPLAEALRTSSVTTTASLRKLRLRSVFLVAEIALSVILLTGAGLMARSFIKLRNLDLGFQPGGVLTAQVFLAPARYPVDSAQFRPLRPGAGPVAESKPSVFFGQLIDELQRIPGVQSVGAVSALPLNPVGTDYDLPVIVQGKPRPRPGEEPQADFRVATSGYFRAMRIPLLRGRDFTDYDGPNSTPVVIINDTLSQQMFPDENPVGQQILLYGRTREIVGVVGSVRHHGFSRDARPEMILPYRQLQFNGMTMVVRSELPPSTVAAALTNAVHSLDSEQPVHRVRALDSFLSDSVAQPRFTALLLGGFATLALALALVGVYGVMSYIVSQRSREIGVRLALGAQRHEVVGIVARQSLNYAIVGVVLGLAGAAAGTRLMSGLLFGISATDPATFLGSAGALVLASLAATYVPALHAARVAPVSVLRAE
jgi:putative ABC transport system permease protein